MYTWEDSYAVARLLQERYPNTNLVDVSLDTIYRWTLQLPEFSDDLELANEEILCPFFNEWFEEVYPV
jgi:FeS assembly protein IscX